MLHMLTLVHHVIHGQGLLDEMTPVLGVLQPLPPRMWQPSSLFLPLAVIRELCFSPTQHHPPLYYR